MLECAKCKPVGSVLLVWKRGQCYLKLPRHLGRPAPALRYRGCLSSGGGKSRWRGGAGGGEQVGRGSRWGDGGEVGGLGACGGWGAFKGDRRLQTRACGEELPVEPDAGAVPAGESQRTGKEG